MSDITHYHPIVERIKKLLDQYNCTYKTFEHEEVRTSEEAAAVRPEYTLAQGAKALIVRIKKKNTTKDLEKEFIQVIVPGDEKFDPKKLRTVLNAKDIRFASPSEVAEITGGVQPGGVPPFGNLFGLRVIADRGIFDHRETIFSAGDRKFSIALSSEDYKRIVQPLIAEVV